MANFILNVSTFQFWWKWMPLCIFSVTATDFIFKNLVSLSFREACDNHTRARFQAVKLGNFNSFNTIIMFNTTQRCLKMLTNYLAYKQVLNFYLTLIDVKRQTITLFDHFTNKLSGCAIVKWLKVLTFPNIFVHSEKRVCYF